MKYVHKLDPVCACRAGTTEHSRLASSCSSRSSEADASDAGTVDSADALHATGQHRQDMSGANVPAAAQQHQKKRKFQNFSAGIDGELNRHDRQAVAKSSKRKRRTGLGSGLGSSLGELSKDSS